MASNDNLLVNTGNILSLNELKIKAGQNPSEEVSSLDYLSYTFVQSLKRSYCCELLRLDVKVMSMKIYQLNKKNMK